LSEPKRLSLRDYLIMFVCALVVLAPGISRVPPTDRDESRYAVASTQMLTSGDFVDIRFQDEPRYLQPAGIYWLQAASVAALSSPEARGIWAYRVPSLLGALIAVLLTGAVGAMLFGRSAGLAAAALLAASFSLGFEARAAKIDAALLASITAAQLALMRIYLEPAGPRWRAGLFWAALGAGLMLKGPIIVIVVGATIIALLIWDRRAAWLKGLHAGWGFPLLLLIVLPWFIAIGVISDGAFYARSVGKNLLGKVGASQQSHAGPPGYHLAAFPFAFWPGSLFAAAALVFAWRRRAEPGVRFLIAWIGPAWLIFEAVATKLPHYVLPTYPAIACLAAGALAAREPAGGRWLAALGVAWALLWLIASGVLAALAPAALWTVEHRIDAAVIAVAALAFALSLAALYFYAKGRVWRAVGAAALGGALVWVNVFALVLPALDDFWMTPKIVRAARAAAPCADTQLISNPYHEPSLVFLYGPERTRLVASPGEAAAALAADRACALALIGANEREAFLRTARAQAVPVRVVGSIAGTNYSYGSALELTLYAAGPAPD
jgi:4-amino-4-deoxy-L-arabinose transferase-like glycosyltransferase